MPVAAVPAAAVRTAARRYLRAIVIVLVFLAASCSSSDDEPTTAEILAELEGRELTPAEVAEREEVAAFLCGLDDAVLTEIWDQLDPRQLAFQDFVFGRTCPERNSLYAEATGRFATGGDQDG